MFECLAARKLKLLRDRGLSASQLQLVCQAIIISRLAYALPAWVASCLPTTEIDLMVFCDAYTSVALLYVCLLLPIVFQLYC